MLSLKVYPDASCPDKQIFGLLRQQHLSDLVPINANRLSRRRQTKKTTKNSR